MFQFLQQQRQQQTNNNNNNTNFCSAPCYTSGRLRFETLLASSYSLRSNISSVCFETISINVGAKVLFIFNLPILFFLCLLTQWHCAILYNFFYFFICILSLYICKWSASIYLPLKFLVNKSGNALGKCFAKKKFTYGNFSALCRLLFIRYELRLF